MVANRLPPKVVGNRPRKRRKAPPKPWYRHAPWVLPTLACVVFAVLIGGIIGVRQVVVVLQEGDDGADDADASAASADEAAGDSSDQSGATDADSPYALDERASLTSSEPEIEVLPPKAAVKPGRKLPRMLLVGRRPEMFPTLEAALELAIPGDIIEVRQNRPLTLAPVELKTDDEPATVESTPLTIRAGKGFTPVLRASAAEKQPMIDLAGVDVRVIGLHFATNVPATFFRSENGSASFERCTFTSVLSRGAAVALETSNSVEGTARQIQMDRCLFRATRGVVARGPSINMSLTGSAVYGVQTFLSLRADEEQSVAVERSTIVATYFLGLAVPDSWPDAPPAFRMERSLFGVVACCPKLVQVEPPKSHVLKGPSDYTDALRGAFREFKAGDNIAQFWGWWASVQVGPNGRQLKDPVFSDFPTMDDTLRFGKRIELIRTLIHKAKKPQEARRVATTVLPEDFVPTSNGPLAARMKAGARYGCDVRQLPVPPPATLR